MCRNIKRLHHLDPPATRAEIRDAALQFARKISGRSPSAASAAAFDRAVGEIAAASERFLAALSTPGAPRSREELAARARARRAAAQSSPTRRS